MSEILETRSTTLREIGLHSEGNIQPSNINFSISQDPDAAFRPMLTSYSTRIDGNCGKADDNLEG